MKWSYSRVETLKQCPYKFKLKYIDHLETLRNQDFNNPLYLGTCLHKTLETDFETAKKEFYKNYYISNTLLENELIKIENIVKLIDLPNGKHEILIEDDFYKGYIDFIDSENNLYDFKYSNNINNYLESGQLHIYKYFYEKIYGKKINNLYYLFFPKTFIRQKKTETLEQYRVRLLETIQSLKVTKVKIEYDKEKVNEFFKTIENINKDFPKQTNKYCEFCEYYNYCKKGENWMLLPKNERRNLNEVDKKTIWIYGKPFSGKTTFANKFPDPLMLNTDGNIKFVDAPYIAIKDQVTVTGRLTKRKFAWQVFKEAIEELEKKDNTFKTIVIDLLEDLYEYCRLYMYDQLGITHESDDSFRAWDKVRTEFLSTIKRLMNLDYENIILISHEDSTKDIMKKSGENFTAIKPNLNDKVANKIAGMVDIVARVYVDDNKRILSFKSDEVIFGGGRLNLRVKEIDLDYEKFEEVYK